MRRMALAFALPMVVVILIGANANGTTDIVSISGDTLDTSFDPTTGLLTVQDNCDVVVEYADSTQNTYTGGSMAVLAYLLSDNSTLGMAIGVFGNGSLTVKDGSSQDLLTGVLLDLTLIETSQHNLAGIGQFRVTGGLLAFDFVAVGDVVDLTFNLNPPDISDFASALGGESDVTLVGDAEGDPIPEPLTMFGLLLGICGVGGYVRRKRA